MGSFSFLEPLSFHLPAQAFASFLEGFFYAFFFSLEVLLSSNNIYSSGICIALNVGVLLKFGRAVVAFEVMSL